MENLIEVNIFCHAGSGIGLGHLTRCISIWDEIKNLLIFKIKFHIISDIPILISNKNLIPNFIDIKNVFNLKINSEFNEQKQIFILDFNENIIDDDFINLFINNKNSKIIIAVDSLLKYEKSIDYFFMPTFQYNNIFSKVNSNKISWGWDHFLLNPKYKPKDKEFNSNKLLILTGGSDSTKLGQTLPKKLDINLKFNSEINWVVGPFSQKPSTPNNPINTWKIHQSPKSLDDLFLNCNYSITIFGVSFFEMLYYGVPTVVFSPYGNKDSKELAQIKKLGIALVAKDEDDAIVKINELMGNSKISTLLSKNSKKVFKQMGSKTFVNILKNKIYNKWQMAI